MQDIRCPICNSNEFDSYKNYDDFISVASDGKILPKKATLSFCSKCQHFFKFSPYIDTQYYDTRYGISLWHNDADQLYEVTKNGDLRYRQNHQFEVFSKKFPDASISKILDFGAAKGQMAKLISEIARTENIFVYDVSMDYTEYWYSFLETTNTATYTIPPSWNDTFDLVTAFFVLEHVKDLSRALTSIRNCLKSKGFFYFIVPNALNNLGDLLVADHINHFTVSSIEHLSITHGFNVIEIDEISHRGAFCVTFQKTEMECNEMGVSTKNEIPISEIHKDILSYWSDTKNRLHKELKSNNVKNFGIFGAGFYGSLIYFWFHLEFKINSFYDNNAFLVGQSKFNVPIRKITCLNEEQDLILAVNPKIFNEVHESLLTKYASSSRIYKI